MSQSNSTGSELPIPDGWFAVAWTKDLQPGEVVRVRCFDEDLVLFRTRSGAVRVLDGFCAHLGAHLAEGGIVIGETIRCPFHHWHYDGDGQCTKIPYAKKIPPLARVRAWNVVERNRMIFVWHHSEGKPPSWQVPEIPELSDPDWTEPRYFDLEVDTHMQEMAENNCDPVHFTYVHGAAEVPLSDLSYLDDGRTMKMVSVSTSQTPAGDFEIELERITWGLGLASVRMIGIPGAGLLMFSSTAPVSRTRSASRWAFTVTKNLADTAGEQFIEGLSSGVLQDVRIWKNKIYRPRPVLCDGDQFIGEFRRWARQFYSAPVD